MDLSLAITVDFVLTIPFVYFLLIRNKSIPKTTIVPVFVLCIIIASTTLPKDQQIYLSLTKTWLIPLVELTVATVVFWKVRILIQRIKIEKDRSIDFYDAIKRASREVLPHKIALAFSTEIGMISYALFKWKKSKKTSSEFTHYKDNGIIALLGVLIFIIFVETFVIHILIERWSVVFAWILSIASIYTGFQIFGHLKALLLRRTIVDNQVLYLRNGLLGDVEVQLDNIEKVEISDSRVNFEDKEVRNLSPLRDIEGHNTILYFKEKVTINQAYGFSKKVDVLLLQIDDPKSFTKLIREEEKVKMINGI